MCSSVLPVFGRNLSELCALHGSPAQVARELGISRMQMRRYITGESFPKPNQLKQICDHFGVDARILTERLTPEQLAQVARFGRLAPDGPGNPAMKEAMDFIGDLDAFFEPNHELADGLYRVLMRSLFHDETLAQLNMQVTTLRRARVARLAIPKRFFATISGMDEPVPPQVRQLRGVVLGQMNGFCIQFHRTQPRRLSTMMIVEPSLNTDLAIFEGIYTIARGERPGVGRVARCLLRRIPPTCRGLVAAAHAKPFVPVSKVPEEIRTALWRPIE